MERKLALDDATLLSIEQPARYIGGEVNAVMKDKNNIAIRFAMCFPDIYEIGMSHLGIQILYHMFNRREDTWCERVYSPWTDLHSIMRDRHIPLFALESQDPVKDFDFLGITLQYEMCYTNILQILDLSGIPMMAEDRKDYSFPIVIGGGPCTYNPEPIASFFDIFYIGEGETAYDALLDLYKECRDFGVPRAEFLRRAAKIPGMYVPSLYRVTYKDDMTIEDFSPIGDDIPRVIKKELVKDLTNAVYPEKPVVPFIKATQDRVVLEIQRGCIRGCRFCQAGMLYRPVREKNVEELKKTAVKMLESTGHEEISLSSLSSSDYSQLEELVTYLVEVCSEKKINISLPSLRIDAFSLDVMSKVQDVKKSSLTFAPEAGSQRMRNVINKGLTKDDILAGSKLAFEGGWNKVKLYFMLGLPTETEEDIKDIAHLSEEIAELYYDTVPKEKRQGKVQITASSSFFIPKPFTPFQWAVMGTHSEFAEKASVVKAEFDSMLNRKSLRYIHHETDLSELEGIFARGDRRLDKVLLTAYKKGCLFDSWSECFDYEKWVAAFEECGISGDFYTTRERSADEIFPWDFIDIGVTKNFLRREWENAMAGKVTKNCRAGCSGCGAASFGVGVCHER
ncbi:MAG: TIGR03960 family B12-binding radical SAM protein [Lachnospiraceae bacterium]|nr:TIGR03960 family B12-binding radical SAM protein [Lachnospiraceae bacterium]